MTNFEGSSGPCPTKKPWKEKIEAQNFYLFIDKTNSKEREKWFDATKCRLVDDTLGNKFLDYFLLGNDLILGVKVDVHCFKIAPPKLYTSLSRIYIRTRLRRGPQKSGHILPQKPKKWEDI
jgi:hypothetical protein